MAEPLAVPHRPHSVNHGSKDLIPLIRNPNQHCWSESFCLLSLLFFFFNKHEYDIHLIIPVCFPDTLESCKGSFFSRRQ